MSAAFKAVTIDASPQLLEESHRMRYQIYCVERRFLSAEDYPDQRESDTFDRDSVHVGVVDGEGELVGTARIVKPNSAGLPFLRHCSLFPEETALTEEGNMVVEISRVCIARRYTRRRADVFFDAPDEVESDEHMVVRARDRRVERDEVFATLVKAIYRATRRLGATHWIIAVEKSLRRRIAHYGLPFELAGPEADYYGLVAPYIMSMAELDRVICGRQFVSLDHFPIGGEVMATQFESLGQG
jgi:N-acyl amino acid synthase of PEP-CTERM/exosortase system